MKKDGQDISQYAQMGLAALLPGMQRMVELMQQALDEQRALLLNLQHNGSARRTAKVTKSKIVSRAHVARSGWPADPGERSKEMKRRQAVAREKQFAERAQHLHPRDAGHPDHAKWLAKMKRTTKRHWDSLSPAARKRKIAQLNEARMRARKPVEVQLEVAS